uniref:Phosphotransferase n=1 Tax=Janibacter limosus TaxID=53458 RepID=A0AC61U6P1_9MICO|nr:phosphotransferase [Janibacter limosus]
MLDEAGSTPVVYRVPLTYRDAPLEGAEAALVGEMEHSVLGHRWVYDAPHDPVYVTQLLELLCGRVAAQAGSTSDTPDPHIVGAPHPARPSDPVMASSRVPGGEQSNTSIIVTPAPGTGPRSSSRSSAPSPPGRTPTSPCRAHWPPPAPPSSRRAWATSPAPGSDPTVRPGTSVSWPSPGEYLEGASDARRETLQTAAAGTDLGERARELGRVVADVHATLARALPSRAPDAGDVERRVAAMRRRAALATSEVPGLSAHDARVAAVLDAATTADWPALQRIHGDLHPGQVLDVPGRGWMLIDFEGEPLRPLAERNELDSPFAMSQGSCARWTTPRARSSARTPASTPGRGAPRCRPPSSTATPRSARTRAGTVTCSPHSSSTRRSTRSSTRRTTDPGGSRCPRPRSTDSSREDRS